MDATISRSITKFALQFCNELEKGKTTVCSPLSAETVLALTALGCRGQSQAELLQALHLPDEKAIKSLFKTLTPKLQNINGATLNTANKVYVKEGGTLKPKLKKDAIEVFGAELEQLDFKNSVAAANVINEWIKSLFKTLTPKLQNINGATLNTANKVYVKEGGTLKPKLKKDAIEVFGAELEQLDFKNSVAAANVINEWVAENTKGKIKEIASADMLGERTSLFLVNAIYFKALWENQFKKYYTQNRKFHVDNATIVEGPMMYMEDNLMKYGSNTKLKAKFLGMPYQGGKSSMVIVLPDDIEGLDGVLQQLAAGHDLMADIQAMKETEALTIMIPTFKAETTINVKDLLQKMGVERIFNIKTSEIDMLTSPERLYVSHAVQKAYIMVNEAGTEAAAATVNVQKERAMFKRPRIPFTADRPFLFLLTVLGIPVFVGVYRGGQETVPSDADFPVEVAKEAIDLSRSKSSITSSKHCCVS